MLRTAAACAAVCAVALLPLAATAQTESLHAKVISYSSGTAFAVLDPGKKLKRVKLTGVDAPERKQRFAAEARQLAAQWLSTKPIDIAVDGTDKDARIVGRVVVDGRDVALVLIEAGLAWCDPADDKLLSEQTRTAYRAACEQAKAQRRGVWQEANPVAPWEYRKIPEFDPLPAQPRAAERNCKDVGYQTVQCDDGKSYRVVGNDIIGSDGSVYARRGNTYTGEDGSRYTQQGPSTYGSDGTVCRSRGRQTSCY
jgi:endonuclease YncB( thermonuclease family)